LLNIETTEEGTPESIFWQLPSVPIDPKWNSSGYLTSSWQLRHLHKLTGVANYVKGVVLHSLPIKQVGVFATGSKGAMAPIAETLSAISIMQPTFSCCES